MLLARLGEDAFNYYSFESPSADTDIWPMFEALLLDERVVGRSGRPGETTSIVAEQAHEAPEPMPVLQDKTAAPIAGGRSGKPGVFGRYGSVATHGQSSESVRDMLGRLAIAGR